MIHDWLHEKIYHQSQAFFEDLFENLKNARKTIFVEVYLLEDDEVGREFLDILKAMCQKGVQVRLCVDGIGSSAWLDQWSRQQKIENFQLRAYHPLPWPLAKAALPQPGFWGRTFQFPIRVNRRNHKKVFIIDEQIAYTGSINVFSKSLEWREAGVRLSGGNLEEIRASFAFTWQRSLPLSAQQWKDLILSQRLPLLADKAPEFTDSDHVQTNFPRRNRIQLNKRVVNSIQSAKDRIWVTTPYFVPPMSLLKALCQSAHRGVDVKIILPRQSDVPMVSFVSKYYYAKMLKAGVQVYEYLPSILHAKVFIIDELCSLGSTNFNHRSFLHDLELNIITKTDNSRFVLMEQFKHDLDSAEKITTISLKKRKTWEKCLAYLILLFRNWI